MSENISNELPVITSIEELPETAIEELTDGQEVEKATTKKSSTTKKSTSKKFENKQAEEVAKDE